MTARAMSPALRAAGGAGRGRLRPAQWWIFEAVRFLAVAADPRRALFGGLPHRQGAVDGPSGALSAFAPRRVMPRAPACSPWSSSKKNAATTGAATPTRRATATEESQARARRAAYRTLELAGESVELCRCARHSGRAAARRSGKSSLSLPAGKHLEGPETL